MLGVAVGICQQAIQQAQQQQPNQSAAQSALAANTSSGATSPISCPERVFPRFSGRWWIYDKLCWFDVRGAHVVGGAERRRFSMSQTYTDGTCSVLFRPGDLTITNPPAPAQSGVAAAQ